LSVFRDLKNHNPCAKSSKTMKLGGFLADTNYKIGDTLYVWAKSGLKLRSSPNTKSNIIQALVTGTEVKVIEKTNKNFAYKLYEASKYEKHPFLLYGKWVKIEANGNTGYVFDSFLLKIPIKSGFKFENFIATITLSLDTLKLNNQCAKPDVKRICKYGIEYKDSCREIYGDMELTFSNWTIEEVVIFWEFFANYEYSSRLERGMLLEKNWRNIVTLNDNMETCTIMKKSNQIKLYFIWSC